MYLLAFPDGCTFFAAPRFGPSRVLLHAALLSAVFRLCEFLTWCVPLLFFGYLFLTFLALSAPFLPARQNRSFSLSFSARVQSFIVVSLSSSAQGFCFSL